MENGIIINLGWEQGEKQASLLSQGAAAGIKRLLITYSRLTCASENIKDLLYPLLHQAKALGMEIILDVTPMLLERLGLQELSSSAFRMLGVQGLRLSDEFAVQDIIRFSHNHQWLRLLLNASTMTSSVLSQLLAEHINLKQVEAIHCFYPRPGTGLSEEFLVRKNILIHRAGMRVGAFVAAQTPSDTDDFSTVTLEEHRQEEADVAARHLVALGIDFVFLGGNAPQAGDLKAIGQLRESQVTMRAQWLTNNIFLRDLLNNTFTARSDEARDAIRAQEGQMLLAATQSIVAPDNRIVRPIGAITIDNLTAGDFMGEIQLIRHPQAADSHVNVAAMVDEAEVNLLQYITPGRKFSFIFHE